MRHAAAVAALALVACSHGAAHPRATPSPSPSPSPAAGVVVAVTRPGGAALYRIGRDRRAEPLVTLTPPEGRSVASSVTMTSAATPAACVAWSAPGEDFPPATVVCYEPGSATGTTLDGTGRSTYDVALRPDGGALAWVESYGLPALRTDVVWAAFDNGRLGERHRAAPDEDGHCDGQGCFYGRGPGDIAWSGDATLVLSVGAESDDGSNVKVLRLGDAASREGWDSGRAVEPHDAGYDVFQSVVAADATSAYAVERAGDFAEKPPPQRAMRADLATGRVLEVVSTPSPGRDVLSVSGGPRGVVYVTGPSLRAYLRLPGEAHGTAVTGLPADATAVVAQP